MLLFPAAFLQNLQQDRADTTVPRPFSLSATTNTIPPSGNQENYTNIGSWAVGVVVPQNSLTNVGKVEWENVVNVTALLRMPNISRTDGPLYLVLSLMTSNGAIIQVAAGIYPNTSTWGTYGMDILQPTSYPQGYNTVVSSLEPAISAGQLASMSLYVSGNSWNLKLVDLNTSKSTSAAFGSADLLPLSLKIGDQFVIALESYTSNSAVFENMGNFTMESLLVNGARVISGPYTYSGWDNVHYPLFSVGGATPPSFISVSILENASVVWSFFPGWTSGSPGIPINFTLVYLVIGGVAAIAISVTTLVLLQRRRRGLTRNPVL